MEPLPGWYRGPLMECDRCGWTYAKEDLNPDPVNPQYLVCSKCSDKPESMRVYVEGGSVI